MGFMSDFFRDFKGVDDFNRESLEIKLPRVFG
jgi:hypothetical protein